MALICSPGILSRGQVGLIYRNDRGEYQGSVINSLLATHPLLCFIFFFTDQINDENCSFQRGNVSIGKAAEHEDDGLPASKWLIAFFCFVVIGSSLVQIFGLFQRSPPPLGE